MATSFDVNLKLGSQLAFNVVGGGIIRGGYPQIQTVHNLDGQDFTTSSFSSFNGPLLKVNQLEDFITPMYTTSTRQTVYLTNIGSSVLTITSLTYSFEEDIGPRFYYTPGAALLGTGTITIMPGTTSTFEIAYRGTAQGLFNNYFTLGSNSIGGYYRVLTHQIIGTSTGFEYSPKGVTTTTTHIGQNEIATYTIIPIWNTAAWPDWPVEVTGTMSGSTAWTVLTTTATNKISVNFNPNKVNNVNGTYISTLTIAANGAIHDVTNTATISIDHDANRNLSSWISPGSYDNSIIGMSYDLLDNKRYLTIGVGVGGDGSPLYATTNGSLFANMADLGLGADTYTPPYSFWSTVYKIYLPDNTAKTYFSGDADPNTSIAYKIKEQINYSQYFGEYTEPGSMFSIEDDGYGSLTIEINHLRELSGDESTDRTLKNLKRAFYYYSDVDVPIGQRYRIASQPVEYQGPIATNTANTYMFIGFDYNTSLKLATVNTSIVEKPDYRTIYNELPNP